MLTKKKYLETKLITLLEDLDNPQGDIKGAMEQLSHELVYISLGEHTFEPLSMQIAHVKLNTDRYPELISWLREELPGADDVSCEVEDAEGFSLKYNSYEDVSEKSFWLPTNLIERYKEAHDNLDEVKKEILRFKL